MLANYKTRAEAYYWKNVFSDYENELKLICAELRRRRIEKGYSLGSISRILRIPKRRLYKIECGNYPYVSPTYFWIMAAIYGASPREILSVIPGFRFQDVDYLDKRYSLE